MDLVFEIGTEELPSSAAYEALSQLEEAFPSLLRGARLGYREVRVYATPRRLAVVAYGIQAFAEGEVIRKRGPSLESARSADGSWTKAAEGFAFSQGVSVDDLLIEDTDKGKYVFAVNEIKGKPAAEILPGMLESLIASLKFKKSMRWGDGDVRFSRPVRWILAVLDGKVLPVRFGKVVSAGVTYGHRYLCSGPIEVKDPSSYFRALEEGGVIVSHRERMDEILKKSHEACFAEGSRPLVDEDVLSEVAMLVEKPEVLLGSFSADFLSLPRDILTHAVKTHQRYFPVEGKDGFLKPRFVVVHNGDSSCDDMIRKGHERVLKARLEDARFFYGEDRKRRLEERLSELEKVVYQSELGSMREKTERLVGLVSLLGGSLGFEEVVLRRAARAALLSKCDLVTHMVTEFPDLEGIVGRVYAIEGGEEDTVAEAIREQYLPRKGGDALPSTLEGALLSLAEKFDNLAASFGLGHVPTSSEDPYGLRRQIYGILKILVERGFDLSVLDSVVAAARQIEAEAHGYAWSQESLQAFADFFKGRARVFFEEMGYRYDHLDAALCYYWDFPYRTKLLLDALEEAREDGSLERAYVAFERCFNLSRGYNGDNVSRALLSAPVENELVDLVEEREPVISDALARLDFRLAIDVLCEFSPVVDKLFDEVLIMDDDPRVRANRLSLLLKVVSLFKKVCDFTMLRWD